MPMGSIPSNASMILKMLTAEIYIFKDGKSSKGLANGDFIKWDDYVHDMTVKSDEIRHLLERVGSAENEKEKLLKQVLSLSKELEKIKRSNRTGSENNLEKRIEELEKDVDCLKELKQKELLEEREKLLEEQKESDKRHYLRTFLE